MVYPRITHVCYTFTDYVTTVDLVGYVTFVVLPLRLHTLFVVVTTHVCALPVAHTVDSHGCRLRTHVDLVTDAHTLLRLFDFAARGYALPRVYTLLIAPARCLRAFGCARLRFV